MEGRGNRVSCRNLFKKSQILPLTSHYMLSLLMFLVHNKILTNNETHNLDPDKEIIYTFFKKLNHLSKSSLLFGDKNF